MSSAPTMGTALGMAARSRGWTSWSRTRLDRLASEGVCFKNAIAGLPVCCPSRASLLTGQRPLTHGVFLNDVPLRPDAVTIAKVLGKAGYDTGYIGKWHLNGDGRSTFIPRERRQGFEWAIQENRNRGMNLFASHC